MTVSSASKITKQLIPTLFEMGSIYLLVVESKNVWIANTV